MKYLLDTDSLVTPKNSYYPMNLCSRFWDWLVEANQAGLVYSIQKVKEELLAGKDELADWAKQRDQFFLKPDEATLKSLPIVAQHVQANPYYTEANRAAFYSKADYFLIAQALAGGFTVVTFEKPVPPNSTKIKIPSVCRMVDVKCTDLLTVLKVHQVKLS